MSPLARGSEPRRSRPHGRRPQGPLPPGPRSPGSRSPHGALTRQLRWLIGIRLLVITSILVPYGLMQLIAPATTAPAAIPIGAVAPSSDPEVAPQAPTVATAAPPATEVAAVSVLPWAIFLRLAGFVYAISLLYLFLHLTIPGRPAVQAYFQFAGDLGLTTALVYYTGGLASPFSIFYLVVIAVASTLLRRKAGFNVATGAYLLYAFVLIGLYSGWLPQPATLVAESGSLPRLVYHLLVSFLGFYTVAFLTYQLAHQFARTAAELEEKREDLADLEVVHRDVIQSINSGLITTSLDGIVTSVNRAGEEILGASEAEIVGVPLDATPMFGDMGWQALVSAGAPGEKLRSEVEIPRTNGALFVGYSLSALSDDDGTLRGYILIFQDLTRWRQLQEEVRIKDRMAGVGELAAGIAHEIGNPLAAISGSVQMLAKSLGEDRQERKLVDILIKESRRLDRTVKGFLRFAQPHERQAQPFEVAALLRENFELLRNSDEVGGDHRLELVLDPPHATLVADPDQVSQIFWNLARNALKAMPAGGRLEVRGTVADDRYVLAFLDTGRGMSAEERANLFHPFKSFFDSGSGIGMAIVYRIVEEHGGDLRVDSRPGEGSTIAVELPLAGREQSLEPLPEAGGSLRSAAGER